jgi:hypothetical protein
MMEMPLDQLQKTFRQLVDILDAITGQASDCAKVVE